jgi:hypothetical protein
MLIFSGNELMRASFFEPGGMIVNGSKFGIAVGDDRRSIGNKLKVIGLKIDDISRDLKCASRKVSGDYALYSYDMSWRRGVICIGISQGRVRSIAWSFSAFAP